MTGRLEVDAVGLLINHLADYLTVAAEVDSATPSDLTGVGLFVRLVRVGGSDDGVTLDNATVVAHCFGPALADATMLALKVGTAYRAMRGVVHDGAVITRVGTLNGPAWTPYGNPNVEQVVRTDRISIKGT